jgi:hypothetical protein
MVAGVRGRAAHGGDTIRARRAGVPGFVHTRRRVHSPGVVSMATRRQAAKPGVGVDPQPIVRPRDLRIQQPANAAPLRGEQVTLRFAAGTKRETAK